MPTCHMCLQDTRNRRQPVTCDACRGWSDYWNSLTPEEQRAEELSMARYATESEGI